MRLVEATSGNTGIALAMIASVQGFPIELVMPRNSTRERVLTMQAFGATVTLLDTIEHCRDYAVAKADTGEYWMLNQFANPDNFLAHYRTTGPELWRDTTGQITHFVATMGTTGTIMGVSRFLKEQNPAIQIVGCQPADGASIPGIRKWPTEYLPRIFEPHRVDRIMEVSEEEATAMTRRLAREEGVFGGMSSGGGVSAGIRLATELHESGVTNALIVCIICDRGDRYLSSGLFG
jgi:S-sulfo-L-cysteine synthase (O-acetyl-L-serine-dependent)